MELRIRSGKLDDLDIPAGPGGSQTTYVDDLKCLRKIREYRFTHDALFGAADWSAARAGVSDAIDRLRP